MTELNLTELDALERAATAGEWRNESRVIHASLREGSSVHPASCNSYGGLSDEAEEANAELIAAARSQLRPLLELVVRMGEALEALTIPLWTGVGFPPTLAVTAEAYTVLKDYRKAKGS